MNLCVNTGQCGYNSVIGTNNVNAKDNILSLFANYKATLPYFELIIQQEAY